MAHPHIMPSMFSARRMPLFVVAFILTILLEQGSAGLSIEEASKVIADPSVEPSYEASMEPTPEPELSPMAMSVLVIESYMRHVDFIRQGLPMALVRSFYNHALKEAAGPGCIPGGDTVILGNCTTPLFDENDGYALKSLQNIISQDEGRPITEKYFPILVAKGDLPALTSEEVDVISAAESETLQGLSVGETNGWEVSVFPSDEEIRFDPAKDVACTELEKMMPSTGLTMTASSLTAFVLGMAAQIIVVNGNSPQARVILDKHVQLMFLAARCNRMSGDKLEVPTEQLTDLVRKAKLALMAWSGGNSEPSLPSFELMKDVIDGSRNFFVEEIERMSSMNSFGRSHYLTWTGNSVSSEALDSRMAGKASLEAYKAFFEERAASSPEPDVPCDSGYAYQKRLVDIAEESCCAETCIVSSGRRLDVCIVNEMCCDACNEVDCDLSKLARVIQVEAFRFARSGEQ